MSCRKCSYRAKTYFFHENGTLEEKYICMGQKEAPEVKPDDICEFYKEDKSMSCKTCIYCVAETREMEHGPDQEFYKCTFYEGAPYVHVDDICGNYSNGAPEIEDLSDRIHKAKELYGIKNPPVNDVVSHPSHYTAGRKYEPKDVIRDWELNFNLGSAVKYISRAGRKDDMIQDLKKARQFLDFEIDYLEEKFK